MVSLDAVSAQSFVDIGDPKAAHPWLWTPWALLPYIDSDESMQHLEIPLPTKYSAWITENMKNSCWLRWSKYKCVHWGGLRSCSTTEGFVCQDLDTKHGICPWLSSQIQPGKYPSSKPAQPEPAVMQVLTQHHLCCSSISHPLLLWQAQERKIGKKLQLKCFPKVSAQQHLHQQTDRLLCH